MSSRNLFIRKVQNTLQLLAVSYYLTEFGLLICIYPFLFIGAFFTILWPIALLYAIWLIYDYGQHERGGRQFEWFKKIWIWKFASQYFPVKLIKTEELSPDRNYIFCLQPHGLFSLGTIFSLVTDGAGFSKKFQGLKQHILTVPAQVVTPIHREISMALGYVSASKKSLLHLLDKKNKGNAAMLMLGGSYETIFAYENSMNICIKERKGFIKIAIQTGTALVPVIIFGENNMYHVKKYPCHHWIIRLQKALAEMCNMTFVVFKGRGLLTNKFGLLPFRTPINTVVGKAIEVDRCDNPTQDEIDSLHQTYLNALISLYEEYNPVYGNEKVVLNII